MLNDHILIEYKALTWQSKTGKYYYGSAKLSHFHRRGFSQVIANKNEIWHLSAVFYTFFVVSIVHEYDIGIIRDNIMLIVCSVLP